MDKISTTKYNSSVHYAFEKSVTVLNVIVFKFVPIKTISKAYFPVILSPASLIVSYGRY